MKTQRKLNCVDPQQFLEFSYKDILTLVGSSFPHYQIGVHY